MWGITRRNTSHRTGIQHRRRFMLRRIKSIDHIHIPSNATVHRYPARHHPDTIQPTEGAAHTDSRHPSSPSRPAAGTQPCSLRPSGLSRMACPQNQPGTIRPLLSITYADQRTPTDAPRPAHPDQRTPTRSAQPLRAPVHHTPECRPAHDTSAHPCFLHPSLRT